MEGLNYGEALNKLIKGEYESITRLSWCDSYAKPVIKVQRPDENSKMSLPYLYMEKTVRDEIEYEDVRINFPVDLSCESIFAEDWVLG